jgi:hypothetical protein
MRTLFPVSPSLMHEKPSRCDSKVASLGIEIVVYGTFLIQALFVSLTTGLGTAGMVPAGQIGASTTSVAGIVGVGMSVGVGMGAVAVGSKVGVGVDEDTAVGFPVAGMNN